MSPQTGPGESGSELRAVVVGGGVIGCAVAWHLVQRVSVAQRPQCWMVTGLSLALLMGGRSLWGLSLFLVLFQLCLHVFLRPAIKLLPYPRLDFYHLA